MRETVTSVATASGDLRAIVRYPGTAPLLPGIVLVDGSGEGAADNWGQWPAVIGGCGAVVLAHDKPGSGGSPGDWRDQTFADRACESLAALEVLRKQPGVDPGRLGFLGISQGGWVSYLAACMDPQAVSQVVAISGPGVSVAEQERYRIALCRPWYRQACDIYDIPELLPFLARNLAFDPATVLPDVRCPVFAAFGGADTLVPVPRSVAVLSELLPGNPRHALAVLPSADHNLFTAEPDHAILLSEQLAPGFLPMLTSWFSAG